MNCLVCANSPHLRRQFIELLARGGYTAAARSTDSLDALRRELELDLPEVTIVVHTPPTLDAMELRRAIGSEYAIPFILAAGGLSRPLADQAIAAGYAAFLIEPFVPAALHGAVAAAINKASVSAPLQEKVFELERKLAERKLIEKAKGLLMEREGLSEELAFRRLRSLAMSRRVPMAKVASEIIGAPAVRY